MYDYLADSIPNGDHRFPVLRTTGSFMPREAASYIRYLPEQPTAVATYVFTELGTQRPLALNYTSWEALEGAVTFDAESNAFTVTELGRNGFAFVLCKGKSPKFMSFPFGGVYHG